MNDELTVVKPVTTLVREVVIVSTVVNELTVGVIVVNDELTDVMVVKLDVTLMTFDNEVVTVCVSDTSEQLDCTAEVDESTTQAELTIVETDGATTSVSDELTTGVTTVKLLDTGEIDVREVATVVNELTSTGSTVIWLDVVTVFTGTVQMFAWRHWNPSDVGKHPTSCP